MTRRLLANGLVLLVLALAGTYAVVGGSAPALDANGPVRMQGTGASDAFTVATHVVRRVQYRDRATLDYAFRLTNSQALPVTVTGIEARPRQARLLRFVGLRGPAGERRFSVPAYGSRDVHLLIRMAGCEAARGRTAAAVDTVLLHTERLGISAGTVPLRLPEQLRTGVPRTGRCRDA